MSACELTAWAPSRRASHLLGFRTAPYLPASGWRSAAFRRRPPRTRTPRLGAFSRSSCLFSVGGRPESTDAESRVSVVTGHECGSGKIAESSATAPYVRLERYSRSQQRLESGHLVKLRRFDRFFRRRLVTGSIQTPKSPALVDCRSNRS